MIEEKSMAPVGSYGLAYTLMGEGSQVVVDDPENDPEGIDFAACDDQAREASSLGDLPLVVITADGQKNPAGDPANIPGNMPPGLPAALGRMRLELQAGLPQLSTRGRQVIAQHCGHYVHLDQPDLVVSIIKKMVEECRAGGK